MPNMHRTILQEETRRNLRPTGIKNRTLWFVNSFRSVTMPTAAEELTRPHHWLSREVEDHGDGDGSVCVCLCVCAPIDASSS